MINNCTEEPNKASPLYQKYLVYWNHSQAEDLLTFDEWLNTSDSYPNNF